MKRGYLLLGGGVSLLTLYLSFRQVDLDHMKEALLRANYVLIGSAISIQLLVIAAIAFRWSLLFVSRPRFWKLVNALLIAHLVNGVFPLRLGVLARALLISREKHQGKIVAFSTVINEKVFDSLGFLLLCAVVIPVFSPAWLQWSSLGLSTVLFGLLFPVLVVATYQRQHLERLIKGILTWIPWSDRIGLVGKISNGMERLSLLRGSRKLVLLWFWTLAIYGLGILVNYVTLRAFDIQLPLLVSALLLVALQIGGRLLPAMPLGGIGLFQYICVAVLSFFQVDPGLALTFGFALHFAVFVPASVLGVIALYRAHYSLQSFRSEVEEQQKSTNQ